MLVLYYYIVLTIDLFPLIPFHPHPLSSDKLAVSMFFSRKMIGLLLRVRGGNPIQRINIKEAYWIFQLYKT